MLNNTAILNPATLILFKQSIAHITRSSSEFCLLLSPELRKRRSGVENVYARITFLNNFEIYLDFNVIATVNVLPLVFSGI